MRATSDTATLLSSHGGVLMYVARHPDARVSEIAAAVGLKERAVQRILADLRDQGLITSTRRGRRNRYSVNRRRRFRLSSSEWRRLGEVVDALTGESEE